MKKAIVQVGWNKYVVDTQKALTLLELLADAEVYETKWVSGGTTTHHIYSQQDQNMITEFKVVPTAFYHMAKLAGKPAEKSS